MRPTHLGVSLLAAALSVAELSGQQQDALQSLAQALATPTDDMIRADVRFLSDDLLMGRAAGTEGGDLAAHYVASRFEAIGLDPAGKDGSYFVSVPLVGVTPQPSLVIGAGRRTIELAYRAEFVAWSIGRALPSLTADGDLVFVGYGIRASEWGWDDYGSTSLTGRVALMLDNDPGLTDSTRFRGRTLTHHGHWTRKIEQAERLGAVGVLLVHSDRHTGVPWTAIRALRTGEQLQESDGNSGPLRFAAWVTEEAARRITGHSGRDWDLLVRRAQLAEFQPIPLDAHAVLHSRNQIRAFESVNVIGRVSAEGTAEHDEAVALLAHYDHLGTRPATGPDSIYNGARDNASGVGVLLAAAAGIARAKPATRRSILFIATTAGEPSHLGARALVSDPPVPLQYLAAVINTDRASLGGRTRDADAVGGELSSLGDYFQRAAAAEGLETSPEPGLDAGLYFHSDQLPFATAGVPALLLRPGVTPLDTAAPGALESEEYLRDLYHHPGDDLRDTSSLGGAVQQARLLIRLALDLAQTGDFPRWTADAPYRPAGERLRRNRRMAN